MEDAREPIEAGKAIPGVLTLVVVIFLAFRLLMPEMSAMEKYLMARELEVIEQNGVGTLGDCEDERWWKEAHKGEK